MDLLDVAVVGEVDVIVLGEHDIIINKPGTPRDKL